MKLPNTPGFLDINIADYLDEIYELDVATCKATPSTFPFDKKEDLLNFLQVEHKTQTFVYIDNLGRCVGYLSYIEIPDSEDRVELLNLMIHPNSWRKGYGTIMVKHYLERMKKLGYKKSKLVTSPENTPAQGLYESMGYEKKGILKDYYGPGKDRVLMVCEL